MINEVEINFWRWECLISFVSWNINLRGSFNAKATLSEEQMCYLTHSLGYKGFMLFPRVLARK